MTYDTAVKGGVYSHSIHNINLCPHPVRPVPYDLNHSDLDGIFFFSINKYWTPTRLAMLQIPSARAYVVRLYIYYAYVFVVDTIMLLSLRYDLQDDDYYYYYYYNNMFYIIRNRTLELRRR